jgi:pimeloyl-ACP methyl ester carboxylesterase
MIMISHTMPATTGQVISADGTRIGYRQLGSGPGLLILHGGALSGRNYRRLAAQLADGFTVYLPDRRGRGLSGPYRSDHSIATEDADLAALVRGTGARYAFGTADGGLFALHAAATLTELQKIIAYEPVVFVGQSGQQEFAAMITEFIARVDAGDLLGAATVATKAAFPEPLRIVPDAVYRAVIGLGFRIADLRSGEGYRNEDLLATLKPELAMVRATEGRLDDFRRIDTEVLLLRGSRSAPLITGSVDALHAAIPHARTAVLPGLLHGSAQDTGGSPRVIAAAIRSFLAD